MKAESKEEAKVAGMTKDLVSVSSKQLRRFMEALIFRLPSIKRRIAALMLTISKCCGRGVALTMNN